MRRDKTGVMDEHPDPVASPVPPARGSEAERWLALALRTVHLAGVVALGAALLGAPLARGASGAVVLASGVLLFAQDLRARRIALGELAGAVVLLKLAAVAWSAWAESHALVVFWGLLVLSSLSSHAPKRWRHRALRRR
jgi:hypothetical protein